MIAAPWDLIFTVLFAATGLYCLIDLVRGLRARGRGGALDPDVVIDVTHVIMSAAMILMVWVNITEVVLWTLAVLFAILAVALVPAFRSAADRARRLDLAGHVTLDVAMIWMLAAMPLLMAGMGSGTGEMSGMDQMAGMADMSAGGEAGDGGMMMTTATPLWADLVNVAFVVLSAAAALWWLARAVRTSGHHRGHFVCHTGMAAGMAAMLVVMNA